MTLRTTHPGWRRRSLAVLCALVIGSGNGFADVTRARTAVSQAPASSQDSAPIPAAQLDSLVAPIALYPDPLLAQVLAASTYPLELIQLAQWLAKNSGLKGKALADAVAKQPWDPSVQAMAGLPDVVKWLTDDIQWTTDLGNAFLAQQAGVMTAVQRMRQKAQAKGTLKSTEQQVVQTKTEGSTQVIVIEQSNPEVIYVPSYNPVTVYGSPVYPYPPIYYPSAGMTRRVRPSGSVSASRWVRSGAAAVGAGAPAGATTISTSTSTTTSIATRTSTGTPASAAATRGSTTRRIGAVRRIAIARPPTSSEAPRAVIRWPTVSRARVSSSIARAASWARVIGRAVRWAPEASADRPGGGPGDRGGVGNRPGAGGGWRQPSEHAAKQPARCRRRWCRTVRAHCQATGPVPAAVASTVRARCQVVVARIASARVISPAAAAAAPSAAAPGGSMEATPARAAAADRRACDLVVSTAAGAAAERRWWSQPRRRQTVVAYSYLNEDQGHEIHYRPTPFSRTDRGDGRPVHDPCSARPLGKRLPRARRQPPRLFRPLTARGRRPTHSSQPSDRTTCRRWSGCLAR